MLINFVDQTNVVNYYATPPSRCKSDGRFCISIFVFCIDFLFSFNSICSFVLLCDLPVYGPMDIMYVGASYSSGPSVSLSDRRKYLQN